MRTDPFSLLGMPRSFRVDVEMLEARYRTLQRMLHPDRFAQASASERHLSMQKAVDVNDAYRVLKDPLKRAEALLDPQNAAAREQRTSEGALMFEMMELQEQLSDAKRGDTAQLVVATRSIEERYQSQLEAIAQLFDGDEVDANRARELVDGLRYLTRLRDEGTRLLRAREDEN